eukprot:TRINITY_DN67840_c0_g1_i1.p1 TRINITY_DN67840_c0_g1~~TRINITY_DN67840_c0_g1_i1.p1  ORF type:complete len:299 (+),score=40.06 TRINITY_DN67840_c0_g1_i1:33-929(+)
MSKRAVDEDSVSLQDLVERFRERQGKTVSSVKCARLTEQPRPGPTYSEPELITAALLQPETTHLTTNGSAHLVQGLFRYYHYGLQDCDDHGWGCGYRTAQCILSWLAKSPAPSILQMQRILARTQSDGPMQGRSDSIGVHDVVVLLDELHGAELRIQHISSGARMVELVGSLMEHFDSGGGPVMIGGFPDVFSKTVVGIRSSDMLGSAEFLVIDPHYAGAASLDVARNAKSRCELWRDGFVSWKPLSSFHHDSFYNVGLPKRASTSHGRNVAGTSTPLQSLPTVNWASYMEVVDEGSS